MKTRILSAIATVSILAMAQSASAVLISDANDLFGTAVKVSGGPVTSNPTRETERLAVLIEAFNDGDSGVVANTIAGESNIELTVLNNGGLVAPLSETISFFSKNDIGGNGFVVGLVGFGFEWLSVKQGTDTRYYNVADIEGSIEFSGGWSHYSLFNKFDRVEVPDSGATFGLFGLGLIGLLALRRRK